MYSWELAFEFDHSLADTLIQIITNYKMWKLESTFVKLIEPQMNAQNQGSLSFVPVKESGIRS